jgi:hypothetical protein
MRGFGLIDFLIGLLVMCAVFCLIAKNFYSISPIKNQSEIKSIQEQVDEQVNEIQQMRIQSINYDEKNNY